MTAYIYDGRSPDSERIKEWLNKEDGWHLSWNESRFRLAAPPPFATFAQKNPAAQLSPAPDSLASPFMSSLRSSRSHGDLNDPINGKCIAAVEDGRTWQTSHRAFFTEHSSALPLSRSATMPDDATLAALLARRSRAKGLGGGHATRLVDRVEHKWTVLYSS